jgi:hypothetical protein
VSGERERVLIARTKLQNIARLTMEALRELQGTAIVASHPFYAALDALNLDAQRTLSLAEQTLKRCPTLTK